LDVVYTLLNRIFTSYVMYIIYVRDICNI